MLQPSPIEAIKDTNSPCDDLLQVDEYSDEETIETSEFNQGVLGRIEEEENGGSNHSQDKVLHH